MILELIGKIILWSAVALGGSIFLLAIVYLASGIQARAWLAVFEEKLNKLKKESNERKNEQFPGQSN